MSILGKLKHILNSAHERHTKARTASGECRFRPRLEMLEDRIAPADYTFIGDPAPGALYAAWQIPANWTHTVAGNIVFEGIPGAGDTAIIPAGKSASTDTANDVAARITVANVTVSGGSLLVVSGASLLVSGNV